MRFLKENGNKPLACNSPLVQVGKDGKVYRVHPGYRMPGDWWAEPPSVWPDGLVVEKKKNPLVDEVPV